MTTISSEPDPLAGRLRSLILSGRPLLVVYLTAGYPHPDRTPDLLRRLADAGADVLELGIPFSDPLADGPTIQMASQMALQSGASMPRSLDALSEFRRTHDTPVVVFSYLNPVLAYGPERFVNDAVSAGADGALLTDLPLGGDPDLERRLERSPLALVRLVAPTTGPERAAAIAGCSQGFLYYISRTGVTGAAAALRDSLAEEVGRLRPLARVPVVVGFGISRPEHAAALAGAADGVVVGSAVIDAIETDGPASAGQLVAGLRAALDGA